ncbi:MAG: pyridoxal phosphate-dependent aminotransferase family protein [Acidobacteria bacterium]|nr:pyridoxal phosphate-dependent aminotransferase family protein [Acidobacteriota bacterium]
MDLGLYPYFRAISSEQDTEVVIDGKKMLMLGSNSYLGLTNDPRVKKAAADAVMKFGTGCAGSRFLNGTLAIHEELEERLAALAGKESALLFSTGFMVNQGVISALVGPHDYIITDQLDHASIVEGARLSFGRRVKFAHNDMGDLEKKIQVLSADSGKLIAVDGVFSMDGDIADIPRLVEIAEAHGALLLVDEAHSIGVLGKHGEGATAHFGLSDRVQLIMGTFSKSLAAIGGFVASDKDMIHYLRHNARALMFSASPPPAMIAAVMAALDIMATEPERLARLWHNTERMKVGLKAMGFDTGASETPIIPVEIGDYMKTFEYCKALNDGGVFVNPVVPPAVRPNQSLIRVSLMATHTDEQIDRALEIFERLGKQMELI